MSTPEIRICTWNLLAPEWTVAAGERDFFQHAHPWVEWEGRRVRLLSALDGLDADVVCLQEVSTAFYEADLRPLLLRRGYAPHFESRGAAGDHVGVVVAYRTDRFVGERLTGFGRSEDRGRLAAVCVRPVGGGPQLTVVSAHVKWSPVQETRRERLDQALSGFAGRDDGAQLIAGDLNFDPHAHSHWPRWAAAGWRTSHPQTDMPTWAADGRCERLDAVLGRGAIADLTGEPVAPLVAVPGLPSEANPSDHVPLVATFRLA